ncbi:MAG TPA: hypothetical protein VGH19_05985 [Verrucomicrobiae bacterium]
MLTFASSRIKIVHSFHELVTTRFSGEVNALCWQRNLSGDFAEVVRALGEHQGLTTDDASLLRSLTLSPAGKAAVDVLLADLDLLTTHGLAPILDCFPGYPRDDENEIVPTHVYSWHVDSAPVEADTYLCTYYGATSEGLLNEESLRRVDIPETRAALLQEFGGTDDGSFREHLHENCYDLHYLAKPGAQPYPFGLGNLWRIAIQHPESPVLPCIHRAPEMIPGQTRLLLIS